MLNVNSEIALLTKHEKHLQLAPILKSAFNTRIIHTSAIDTDTLGTFDHKIQRKLRADETALKKAYLACELTKCNQGLGSEGSFNSFIGLSLIDQELIAFVDIEHKIEIIARAQTSVPLGVIEANTVDELKLKLATNEALLSHDQRWMVWLNNQWEKGITRKELFAGEYQFPLKIEPDLRAMYCPSRQEVIKACTKDLVVRLTSHCPECEAPDFVAKLNPKQPEYLLCEVCLQPTNEPKPPVPYCESCGYTEKSEIASEYGSAFYCNYCNP